MDHSPTDLSPSETRYVSTAQVGKALGVSVTTVKRWVDEGILPAHRTPGGHRKLLMTDVLRLVREGNLPQADLSRLVPRTIQVLSEPENLHRQMLDAVNSADVDLIRTIIQGGYQSGILVETIADRVISPAFFHVGHQWSTGRLDVMIEHRVTQAVVSTLYEMKTFLHANAELDRPVAVGGAPEHDNYIMPTLLAELTLLDAGWDAINLGPHTPFSALHAALEDLSPRLIWVSVSHLADVDRFVREYKEFYAVAQRYGVPVAVGGRGLTDAVKEQIPYTTIGDGLTQFAAFARSLYHRPPRPKRGRPPGSKQKHPNGNNGVAEATIDDETSDS